MFAVARLDSCLAVVRIHEIDVLKTPSQYYKLPVFWEYIQRQNVYCVL